MAVACPDKPFVRRSRLIPSSWQVRGFCCLPEGALDPEGLLRALVLREGGWGCPPLVGGVVHTMVEWAKLGILEL